MTVGTIIVTFGICAGSWPLVIVGLVVGFLGIVGGKLSGIMKQVH
jgi:hypothetical protein